MQQEENESVKFQFTALNTAISVSGEDEKSRRKFDAEVYSGGRIDNHYYWGRSGVVIDLQNIQLKPKIGLVEEHFGGLRIGVATSFDISNKFQAQGYFLKNKKAQEIVADIDDEYPFQMSWWADPESIEEISAGKTVFVNGQEFTGPLHVFRNVRVHEITICGIGADTQTSIQAFSAKSNLIQQEDTNVDLEQAKARIAEQDIELAALKQQVTQFAADKRNDAIAALAKDVGKEFTDDEVKEMKELDEKAFTFSATQLRKFSTKTEPQKQPLPTWMKEHQADGGNQNQFNAGQPKTLADMAASRK